MKLKYSMKTKLFIIAAMLSVCAFASAANQKATVEQVSSTVTVTGDVDYIISGTTPFTSTGCVDIQNLDHAVVILSAIKPSKVISNWLSYIKINGEPAVNGENCQVKMYGRGAIVFPYGKDFKPLTCYTEPNFGGDSDNSYTEGSSGGFMKTLNATNLNNKIRSFKLKRGYMVTFALGTGGWGYSRCFIADLEDLEIAEMPKNMDARVSSYRLFKWHNAHKAGLASDARATANDALNTSWCYDWGQGNASREPDQEWVPNHIYEDWPPVATCGGVTQSCHMKTNNEPGNPADDHPQDVATVLGNWENLMRTGMRLCSESSHDGSWGHLIAFIDSIDARGWRCDILDLHGYWPSGNFNNMNWYSDYYGKGRPIWISEWIWGASWNNNGCWGNGVTDTQILNETKNILTVLNNSSRVERYAYWNSESKGHIFEGGNDGDPGRLTALGQYYATMDVPLGYNPKNEYVPKVVYHSPYNFKGTYAKTKGTYTLTWDDKNGDMLDSMTVECKLPGTTKYVQLANVTLKDRNSAAGASYTYVDTPQESGAYYYRVCSYPMGEKTPKYTSEVSVVVSASFGNDKVQYGKLSIPSTDAVTTDFSGSFDETPAVFMGLCSNNNSSLYPGNLITSAGKTKFTYQLLPWAAQGSSATSVSKMEEIPFLAMLPGSYKYGELDSEVGVVSIKDTAVVEFANPFPEEVTPIVLVELRNPTLKTYPLSLNIFDVTNTGFKAVCQYETEIAKSNTIRVNLNMCYMAVTPGVGNLISEQLSADTIQTDTLSSERYPLENGIDSVVYTLQHTVRTTYSNIIIAAGTGENAMYGTSARTCTFTNGDETLYFSNPKIFGKCQTSNYPGATILRLTKATAETDKESEHYNRIYQASIKRQHDGTNPAKTTSAYADAVGYIVIDNGADSYEDTFETGETYELVEVPTGVQHAESAPSDRIVAIYNISGVKQKALQKGINVVKYADGKFKKVYVK